jgi:two-component system, NtrC family, nitrogen regulation response regulator GlnG
MANDRDAAEKNHCFRLTGEVDGTRLTYDLSEGEHLLGAAEECDVLLEMAGVSRRQAALTVSEGTLTVDDLGSKNGTFVNGRRVDERTVDEGDWIGFGPVVLYVVRVHPDDARVAIPLNPHRRLSERHDSTTQVRAIARRAEDEPPTWVALLNELTGLLVGAVDPNLTDALNFLRSEVGAAGACLVEWCGDGEPVILCACGSVLDGAELEVVAEEFASAVAGSDAGVVMINGRVEGDQTLTWSASSTPSTSPWGLVLVGDFAHRRAAGPLLEAVLRMLLHSKSEPVHIEVGIGSAAPPELYFSPRHVVGRSSAMTEVYGQLRQLLRGDIPVLITGETGVGKEHVAETLYASSARREGPFVAVNCAAIPSELLEAELFGIESGVATGVTARKGKFQLARGGFLFLDEIGDMSLELQAKLLRALQQLEIHPLGARAPEPIDVRIITATNTDLQALIAGNRFRRDLYYRVAGFTVRVPPLRARRGDIPAFVEHFMRLYSEEIGKSVRGITVKALNAIATAPWVGNVRELEHEVRRLVYLCPEGSAIDSTMLSPEILHPTAQQQLDDFDVSGDLGLDTAVADLERKMIAAALARTKGNRSKAAKLLGISRNGLALKIDRLGLD